MIKGLPRECFVDNDLLEKELDVLFQKNWIAVASLDEFFNGDCSNDEPKDMTFITRELGQHSLIVVRRTDGSFQAFHNVCRHRGTRLLDDRFGTLKNSCITCPYHAWSYAECGSLIGAPNMSSVEEFRREDFGLQTVPTYTWGNLIFIRLCEKGDDFETAMEPLLTRTKDWNLNDLEIVKTLQYEVAANWKLVFQNYSECYHCPTVHPDLNQQTPYKSATNDLESGPILGGPMLLADEVETVSSDGKAVGVILPGLDDQQRRSIYYYTVFPNMFVSAHPDYVMLHRLIPTSVSTTSVHCHFLGGPKSSESKLARAWEMWDNLNRQDWRVCELTQAGVQSPAFRPGPYSNLEPMLVAFDRQYRKVMVESGRALADN